MSVASANSKITYLIAAGQTDYPFPYKFFTKADLKVYVGNAGTLTELVLDYDYIVTPDADDYPDGSTIRLVTSQTVGHTLVIARILPILQGMALPSSGRIDTAAVEQAFDKLVMIAQQLDEQMSRMVQQSLTSSVLTADEVLTEIYNVQADVALKKSQVDALITSNVYGVIPGCTCAVDLVAFTLVNCYMDTILKIRKADCDLGYPANGMVIANALTGAVVTVYRAGVATGFAGLTPGLDAYLSTEGGITQDPDADPTLCAQPVGFAISPTTAFIQPAVPIML